jgi:hypothetical protein
MNVLEQVKGKRAGAVKQVAVGCLKIEKIGCLQPVHQGGEPLARGQRKHAFRRESIAQFRYVRLQLG